MIRRPPRSTQSRSSAASDVYKRQVRQSAAGCPGRPRSTGPNASWDGPASDHPARWLNRTAGPDRAEGCLLYTSDAADDLLCVDLGGRRIIKKKKKKKKKKENK